MALSRETLLTSRLEKEDKHQEEERLSVLETSAGPLGNDGRTSAGSVGSTVGCGRMSERTDKEDEGGLCIVEGLQQTALSVSSLGHSSCNPDGKCNPCAFFHSAAKCKNGTECPFCHSCDGAEFKRQLEEKGYKKFRRFTSAKRRRQKARKEKEAGKQEEATGEDAHLSFHAYGATR